MKTIISLKTPAESDGEKHKLSKTEQEQLAAKLGMLIREGRQQRGLTQEELAKKCGTNKAYISKVENSIKDLRFSSLQKIVETGLGGELNITITL